MIDTNAINSDCSLIQGSQSLPNININNTKVELNKKTIFCYRLFITTNKALGSGLSVP